MPANPSWPGVHAYQTLPPNDGQLAGSPLSRLEARTFPMMSLLSSAQDLGVGEVVVGGAGDEGEGEGEAGAGPVVALDDEVVGRAGDRPEDGAAAQPEGVGVDRGEAAERTALQQPEAHAGRRGLDERKPVVAGRPGVPDAARQ